MSQSPAKTGSSKSRLIIWTCVGLGIVAVLLWDQYEQGNLKPYLTMIGLEEKPTPEKRPSKNKTSKSNQTTKSEQPDSNPPQSVDATPEESVTVSTDNPSEVTSPAAESPAELASVEPSLPETSTPPTEEATEVVKAEPEEPTEPSKVTSTEPVPDPQESPETNPEPESEVSAKAEPNEVAEQSTTEPASASDLEVTQPSEKTQPTRSALETLTNSTTLTKTTETVAPTQNASIPPKIYSYAERIVKKYDLDQSTVLEPAEYDPLSSVEALRGADIDQDKKVTVQELAQSIANYGEHRRIRLLSPYMSEEGSESPGETNRPVSTAVSTAPEQAPESEKSAEQKEQDRRRGLKYSVKRSRLPEGLPSWFLSLDRNGDAQLSISEFAPNASPNRVDEFRKLDLNSDGLVTPDEHRRGPKEKTSTEPVTNP